VYAHFTKELSGMRWSPLYAFFDRLFRQFTRRNAGLKNIVKKGENRENGQACRRKKRGQHRAVLFR
jgi:hypothetical protein